MATRENQGGSEDRPVTPPGRFFHDMPARERPRDTEEVAAERNLLEPNVQPEDPDPWRHRSTTMKCRTCMAFVLKERAGDPMVIRLGRCRRHAPTMQGYPAVFENDWCLDHKLDENK